jgi:hypothetical protein
MSVLADCSEQMADKAIGCPVRQANRVAGPADEQILGRLLLMCVNITTKTESATSNEPSANGNCSVTAS